MHIYINCSYNNVNIYVIMKKAKNLIEKERKYGETRREKREL